VCIWKERAIDPSQRKEKKKEHRQLLSKPKQRSILNKPTQKKRHITNIYSTHTYIDQCGMKKKTTGKHTEANYNSRMKCTTRGKKEKNKNELVN
jgi:hypothetical protein